MEAISKQMDGLFRFRAISTLYVDWGLSIEYAPRPDDKEPLYFQVYYNPSSLDIESYGFEWPEDEDEGNVEGRSWTDEEWRDAFLGEADQLIEAYVPDRILYACKIMAEVWSLRDKIVQQECPGEVAEPLKEVADLLSDHYGEPSEVHNHAWTVLTEEEYEELDALFRELRERMGSSAPEAWFEHGKDLME